MSSPPLDALERTPRRTTHSPTLLRVAALAASLLASPAPAPAQNSPSAQGSAEPGPRGWLIGASFGVTVIDGEAVPDLFAIGIHWTQLRPGRLGADFSLGTMPRALTEGVLAGGARGGVALPLAFSAGVLVLPSVGVSLLGGAGDGGGAGTAGFNAGLAAVIHGAGSAGLRTGVTWHRFGDAGSAVWLWEVALVRVPRPH
jgi:hypothetical protein